MNNIILNTDSYKTGMYRQYPKNTQHVSSYIEARGPEGVETIFLGLQAYIKEYLERKITYKDILDADDICKAHGIPFNREGWEYIYDVHGGLLPLAIYAVEEGTKIETGNVLVQVENTDPLCYWLTTHIETSLLRAIWYPTTVATKSWNCKNLIQKYLDETGDEAVDFKLHDFGSRGVSSEESAGIGAAAHLVNFMGTDTLSGVLFAQKYYNAGVAGFSIPASEHSTITSWGKENEVGAFKNMMDQFPESQAVAIVSDSYDIFNACENLFGETLKTKILDGKQTIVIRPDSGDPVTTLEKIFTILFDKFPTTVNSKGYKVLPDNLRVIWGDGVCYDEIERILEMMKTLKISADNIAFGMGGELLQKCNRDDLKFAMKCSHISTDEGEIDVFKDPITDPGKRSKKGRLALIKENGEFKTIRKDTLGEQKNLLDLVYFDGKLLRNMDFAKVRENSNK